MMRFNIKGVLIALAASALTSAGLALANLQVTIGNGTFLYSFDLSNGGTSSCAAANVECMAHVVVGVDGANVVGNVNDSASASVGSSLIAAVRQLVIVAGNPGAISQATPGPGGTNDVTAGDSAAIAANPTVQNASYVSGNCLGGFNSVTLANYNGESGYVTNVNVTSAGGSTPTLTVYLFDANPSGSTCTDKSTFTLVAADIDKLLTPPQAITLAAPTGTTVSTNSVNFSPPVPFRAGGSAASGVKTVYYALVSGSTFTPAATTDIHVRVGAALN